MKLQNFFKNHKNAVIAITAVTGLLTTLASPVFADTVLSNEQWTVTVSNEDSWSGVNGTGDLAYRGCDRKGNCLSLKNGKVTCREGVCTRSWVNGEYSYVISSPMTENSPSTLTVRKGSQVVLRTTGLK